jgi:hypothetical protein
MRAITTFFCLLLVSGCANGPVAGSSSTDLQRLVGQDVTLSGKFALYGKMGPFIYCNGQPVYLVPQGSYTWGHQYDSMVGKDVNFSGVLHLHHSEPVRTSDATTWAPDYYYFDAETAKVGLK